MTGKAPEWFKSVIAMGLAKLYVLRLDYAPAADTLDGVESVWCETLWSANVAWQEDVDYRRLESAFVRLARSVTRWPAPGQVLEQLPRRPEREKLAAKPPTDEEKARAAEWTAELRRIIRRVPGGSGS